jgi:hypothetical protein
MEVSACGFTPPMSISSPVAPPVNYTSGGKTVSNTMISAKIEDLQETVSSNHSGTIFYFLTSNYWGLTFF